MTAFLLSFVLSWEEIGVTLFITCVQAVTLPRLMWMGLRDNCSSRTQWPGATADEMIDAGHRPHREEARGTARLDYTRSVTTAGSTIIFVNLKDTARDVPSG